MDLSFSQNRPRQHLREYLREVELGSRDTALSLRCMLLPAWVQNKPLGQPNSPVPGLAPCSVRSSSQYPTKTLKQFHVCNGSKSM